MFFERFKRSCGRRCGIGTKRRRAIADLRQAFFAKAGEPAARYGLGFDRVLEHLWHARAFHGPIRLNSITHLDDLVHAIACVDDLGPAWPDLVERYERALIRRCREHQDEIESTLLVRRVFAELQREHAWRRQTDHDAAHSLRAYLASRPLRNWLADRVAAARVREVVLPASARKATSGRVEYGWKNGTFDRVDVVPWPRPLRFSAALAGPAATPVDRPASPA